jgi:hypothetical protein
MAMQFVLLVYEAPEDFARRADPANAGDYFGAWMHFANAMRPDTKGGAPLLGPETATTLRMRDGTLLVQDGPYAATREQLGGLFIIDVPDLDAALAWAKTCPVITNGVLEIRPVMPVPM